MTEKTIQSAIMLALGSRRDVRVFRNQTGFYELKDGRCIRSGLCPGSADLIGWQTVTITPDMVGQQVAVFLSVEVKGPKTPLKAHQLNWAQNVAKAGGIAVVARSAQEAVEGLK